MHWKVKSAVQNAVSLLPSSTSYATYYWLQRRFGGWDRIDPGKWFFVAIETWKRLASQGHNPTGKTFLEVGTGRAPLVPLAFHLMGAGKTITVDLNPYLKDELTIQALRVIAAEPQRFRAMFGTLLDERRYADLLDYQRQAFDRTEFLRRCGILYAAPADATATGLADSSINFHTSNTTLEHLPRGTLIDILREGSRLVGRDGVLIHRIDYADHFSYSDNRLTPLNFLRYSERSWRLYAGNRYMYMNRLRHDDLLHAFESAGLRIVRHEPDVSEALKQSLAAGRIPLTPHFAGKGIDVLATTGAWIIGQKRIA